MINFKPVVEDGLIHLTGVVRPAHKYSSVDEAPIMLNRAEALALRDELDAGLKAIEHVTTRPKPYHGKWLWLRVRQDVTVAEIKKWQPIVRRQGNAITNYGPSLLNMLEPLVVTDPDDIEQIMSWLAEMVGHPFQRMIGTPDELAPELRPNL